MSETYNLDEASNLPDSQVELGLLRAQCKEQSEKIEILSQEVYSLRNRAQAAERVQEEYQAELEIQQQQVSGITASSATSLIKLKENHAKIIEDYESKLHCLEIELSDTKEETYILEEELAKAKKELENLQNTSPIATLKAELQELMEEHAANRLACAQHQDFNKVLLKEKSDLLMDLCSTREYLETTEEKLRICKADMMEQTETLEELRESLALVQNELALLKASPADTACRGNSLFAEVEDKRQAMLKKCSSLTKKYNEMRKDYSAKCNEISSLKLENLQLRRQWQDGVEERDNRDIWMKDNYEIRIKELAGMVEELKKTEKPVFVNGDSKILAYAEQEVDKTKRELRQLQEEMEWRSSERLNEAKALYNTRNELLYFKAEVMSLRAENLILRDKLSEANITDIPSPGKSMKKIMEVSLSPAKDEKKDDLCLNHSEIENVISLENTSRSPSHNPSSRPPVSSLLCSVPKPKRLIEHENREKLQLNDTKISEGEGESLQMVNDQSLISQSDPKPLTGEVAGLNSQDSPHLLYTNGVDETKLLQQEQQEGRVSEILECLALPINSNVSCPTDIESTDQNVDIVFQSKAIENGQAEGSNETLSDFQLQNLPGPSILAKLSCPSSLPVDQNAKTRKVRFVEDNLCEDQESSSSLKEPSHKKLLRIPQPRNYKTKIVASRETVYQ